MTTRTERTRCLLSMRDNILLLVNEPNRAERMQMAQMILRHYPVAFEWDDIAEKAPEWLEKREC